MKKSNTQGLQHISLEEARGIHGGILNIPCGGLLFLKDTYEFVTDFWSGFKEGFNDGAVKGQKM